MALTFAKDAEDDSVMSEINTTPLVDVMLVLLIIFLITIPVVNTSIQVSLPKETNQVRESKPENIVISVDSSGQTFWYDSKVKNNQDLLNRLRAVATKVPQPELQIRGDERADYEAIGRVVYAAQRMSIQKIGFITEPPARQ
jgi:biopolymer transport protein ExbD